MFAWLGKILSWWRGKPTAEPRAAAPVRLERIVLTEGVARTLFDDFAEHRRSERGHEELGWILLGLRQEGDAIALAALPAGAERDAGAAHIRFNSDAQALASRMVRQADKRLQIIGVVHTHPGSLRCPSDGDFEGDRLWVRQLRGGDGVFGIGTADGATDESADASVQIRDGLRFTWYALAADDDGYRTLNVHVIDGPDLATPLRPIWCVIETHAPALNRLCQQLVKVHLERIEDAERGENGLLCVKIPLPEPNRQLRVLLSEAEARYYWDRDGELIAIDPQEPQLDRAVYLILAELAKDASLIET